MRRRFRALAVLSLPTAIPLLFFCALFFQPVPAWAIGDAGNMAANIGAAIALMLMTAIAIYVGAGLFEGAIVAKLFHVPFFRTTGIIVLGNLVSGFFGVRGFFDGSVSVLVFSLLLAFLIELPFLFWAMPDGPKRGANAVKATALVQIASYAVVVIALVMADYPF